jgi:hypothetical protein
MPIQLFKDVPLLSRPLSTTFPPFPSRVNGEVLWGGHFVFRHGKRSFRSRFYSVYRR